EGRVGRQLQLAVDHLHSPAAEVDRKRSLVDRADGCRPGRLRRRRPTLIARTHLVPRGVSHVTHLLRPDLAHTFLPGAQDSSSGAIKWVVQTFQDSSICRRFSTMIADCLKTIQHSGIIAVLRGLEPKAALATAAAL